MRPEISFNLFSCVLTSNMFPFRSAISRRGFYPNPATTFAPSGISGAVLRLGDARQAIVPLSGLRSYQSIDEPGYAGKQVGGIFATREFANRIHAELRYADVEHGNTEFRRDQGTDRAAAGQIGPIGEELARHICPFA